VRKKLTEKKKEKRMIRIEGRAREKTSVRKNETYR